MRFNVHLLGLPELRRDIASLRQRIGDPSTVLRRAAAMVLDNATVNITVGGSPPWAPTKYPSNQHHILIKTGALRNSLSMTNPDAIKFDGPTKVLAGTNLNYARYLQDGTKFMPPRKFLTMNDSLSTRIRNAIADFIMRGSESSGVSG